MLNRYALLTQLLSDPSEYKCQSSASKRKRKRKRK